MDKYISRMKDAITGYLKAAQDAQRKGEEGQRLYNDEAQAVNLANLRAGLKAERKKAETVIQNIYSDAVNAAKQWAQLRGDDITSDSQLLNGQGVTPAQFDDLVSRYADAGNYTMLEQLRGYGYRQNEAARIAAKAETMKTGTIQTADVHFNIEQIPSLDSRLADAQSMVNAAQHFLNVADGSGYDKYSLAFARATADKDFERWGSADGINQSVTPAPDAADAIFEAWGFGAKAGASGAENSDAL